MQDLGKSQKPRAETRESAYFESDELPELVLQVPEGLYRNAFLVALKTGIRQGELAALTWGDVDLLDGSLFRIRRSFTKGRLTAPKNHERRDVDLTEDLVDLLGAWWGECGKPDSDVLVFPGGSRDGFLMDSTMRRMLYAAMEAAGVARVGPTGENRKWHSLRHTYAKTALENGAHITWLQRQLGHSSIKVTCDLYGHFEREARKREAKKLEGAFSV